MANIKSQKKRIRTNEAARMRNKAVKSELKTLTKHVQSAVAEGDAEKAQAALKTVTKRLDMLPPSMLSTRTRLLTASPVLPSS